MTSEAGCRCGDVEFELLESAIQRLIASRAQLDGLAQALPPEQLAGASTEEFAAWAELATDAHQSVEMVMALVNAIDGLAVQLRDRVLDGVVASRPAPDVWPERNL